MWNALQGDGVEVDLISPLGDPCRSCGRARPGYVVRRCIPGYQSERQPWLQRQYGRQIRARLAAGNYDIVLSPGTLPIAYLHTKLRVVPLGANLPREPTVVEVAAVVAGRPMDECRLLFVAIEWDYKGAWVLAQGGGVATSRVVRADPSGSSLRSGLHRNSRATSSGIIGSVKVVILAGGQGTRLAEETETRPKPMVDIGGRPILWHIMKHYAHWGFPEFVVALGYRGDDVKRFFLDYLSLNGDLTVELGDRAVKRLEPERDAWTVHLVDTGLETNTGGRVGRLRSWLADGPFLLTYGDGVSNVDVRQLVEFHRSSGKLATITAVRPPSRFGGLSFDGDGSARFIEKPQIGEGWVNGGFMVLEPGVLEYVSGDVTSLESDVLEKLSDEGKLGAYRHEGFWQSMDTLRDVRYLRALWAAQRAPWATWQ